MVVENVGFVLRRANLKKKKKKKKKKKPPPPKKALEKKMKKKKYYWWWWWWWCCYFSWDDYIPNTKPRLSKMPPNLACVNARFDTNIYWEIIFFLGGGGAGREEDKNWSHFSILNIVSERPKKKKNERKKRNHHWLNPGLSKIESGIPFWRGKVKKKKKKSNPTASVVGRGGGMRGGLT